MSEVLAGAASYFLKRRDVSDVTIMNSVSYSDSYLVKVF
jgi:hypothetical protein